MWKPDKFPNLQLFCLSNISYKNQDKQNLPQVCCKNQVTQELKAFWKTAVKLFVNIIIIVIVIINCSFQLYV